MLFVAPNVLTDINFAEIVEDESHPTNKMKEVFPDKEFKIKFENSLLAYNSLFEIEYLRYKMIYESTHIMELHSPPPNC